MPLTASELKDELRPSTEGEKSLIVKMIPGQRPEVSFTGAWTGKYIKAAMDSIAKGYRKMGQGIRRTVQPPTDKMVATQTQVLPEGRK